MAEAIPVRVPFWKMHGAGNDFILVDDRSETFPLSKTGRMAEMASRRTGIGCEGIILIQPSARADLRMRFFNPNGEEVEMCGNGARCFARLASEIGAAPASMTIETVAGILAAEAKDDVVRLQMTPPHGWILEQDLDVNGTGLCVSAVNTGVPHAVVEVDDLDGCDVVGLGAALRHHEAFAPAGTNADFIRIDDPQSLSVRTYERGVEAETLACGTGIVACALVAARLGRVTPPVRVAAASGDVLTVEFRLTADSAEEVTLSGPAVHVFKGEFEF
jgi:diaminopimelate epimerase